MYINLNKIVHNTDKYQNNQDTLTRYTGKALNTAPWFLSAVLKLSKWWL